ncbi:hypothetical protein Ga0123462_2035 [Mariprofundus ferrinatatus]|uniref:Uncharacterized protein n=1 Tax=Mariprofundus ferrinatatus TaxID=1921087 RepID=A0A2K8L6X8_9PROT|nr:hypothetical protein [Mariprofundus ferrinatatus]ATX82872.1 hypothetical protein Ga0123462_2035 [Mariprofundus ferrinatatus]
MDAYLHSLIAYAIAANLVALPLILIGRKFDLRCHPIEYLALYFNWAVFVLLVGSVFDDLNHAMLELEVSDAELNTVFGVAGFFAGLSLLPKIFFAKKKANTILITSLTAIFISVIYAKFAVLAFLFTVEGV